MILYAPAYAVLWTVGLFIYYCPPLLKDLATRSIAFIAFRIFPFRKKIILHNLALCFPRKNGESMSDYQKRCEIIAQKNYQHYLLSALEILERFHWTAKTVAQRCELVNFELLHKLRQEKKGYFFLTAHLGNWELLTFVGVSQQVPLSIITRYLRSGFWDRLWRDSRSKFGLELMEESGSGLSAVRAIRKKARAVGFIMDQHTGKPHGIRHQFFGVPAWCPKGLAILSMKVGCPVIPAYLVRTSVGRYRAVIEMPLDFSAIALDQSSAASSDETLCQHIGICNQNMEQWIERYPEQYLWLHKRFKETFDYSSPLPWQRLS